MGKPPRGFRRVSLTRVSSSDKRQSMQLYMHRFRTVETFPWGPKEPENDNCIATDSGLKWKWNNLRCIVSGYAICQGSLKFCPIDSALGGEKRNLDATFKGDLYVISCLKREKAWLDPQQVFFIPEGKINLYFVSLCHFTARGIWNRHKWKNYNAKAIHLRFLSTLLFFKSYEIDLSCVMRIMYDL